MAEINYLIDSVRVIDNPSFLEASKEELRALLALIELKGRAESEKSLAMAAGISTARCKSALAFWEGAEVIIPDDGRPRIIEEFEERLLPGEINEVPAVKVAESIRDENLASMIDECAKMMGLACLPNTDVKNITSLHTQYGLSAEFIVILAAYMATKSPLTVKKLCNKAIKLTENGCDSVEALEEYIIQSEKSSEAEWEYRRVMGIYNRSLSDGERACFTKWSETFGYSATIVGKAYDIAVMNSGRGDLRYMDAVLTSWHNAGCKTLSECIAEAESSRAKKNAESLAKKARPKSIPEPPRYGNFDINDAFKKALERSYGADENDKGEV